MPTEKSSTWPVAVVSPERSASRLRSASGSTPRARASFCICRSYANVVCGAPKPRNAPCGGWLVATTRPRTRTIGQRYGPAACSTPRDSTTGDSVRYAPPSITTSTSIATSSPSRRTPSRWRMRAGWRLVVAAMSSSRS